MADPLPPVGLAPAGAVPVSPPPAPPAAPAVPAAAKAAPAAVPPGPADGTIPSPKRGSAPTPDDGRGIDWGRVGIAAGMAPVAWMAHTAAHEGSHGLMAVGLGASDVSFKLYPHTYQRNDGTTGFNFAAVHYHAPGDWTGKEHALVALAPSMLDTAVLAGTTTLYETGHWPTNPWASGALLVWHAAAVGDLAFNAVGGIAHPDNAMNDTARTGLQLGVHPAVIGGIQGALALGGAIEFVRIANDVLRDKKPEAPKVGEVTLQPHATPMAGGGMVGLSGTF
jgi:hypothetical protein